MIVKLVLHRDQKSFSIWNKIGDRLFYSDKTQDIPLCIQLLTVIKPISDKALLESKLSNTDPIVEKEIKESSYFHAKFVKGIVTMTKRASGYDW